MLKISGYKFIVLVIMLLSLNVTCWAAKTAKVVESPWLVPWEQLEDSELKILWQHKVPMAKAESVDRLFVIENCLYVLSDRDFLVSLNREDGKVLFSRFIAQTAVPVLGLELYNDELFSIVGNRLVQLNPEFGTERSGMSIKYGVTCPAARNSSHFYIAGSDRRMHALRAEDRVQSFKVAAQNDSMITSILADENFVILSTDVGNVICIRPDRPTRLWQFDDAGSIIGPIVRDGSVLYFASRDTSVYKLDIFTGKFVWKRQTPAILDRAPRVTNQAIYQYVREEGLMAIDKLSGDVLWKVPQGLDLLAEANETAYVITTAGNLVAMDNKKKEKLYSVEFASVTKHGTNLVDSKIYIAGDGGRIACLEPIE